MARWSSRLMPRLAGALLALALLLAALPVTFAQSDSRYFPETGHTLRGLFRAFWEANGDAGIFGFPITDEYVGPNGQTIQWFERSRFELVTINGQLQVALGNLGSESIGDRIFPKVPPVENSADRRYIPETQHSIQYGFKEIWETRGDMRIFGYPLSEEIDEVLDDGEWHTVQYFEKARFEYWPSFPPGQRVLLSLLGRRLVPQDRTAPGSAAPTPEPSLPPSVNATVSPESGPPGTSFAFVASGFDSGEKVGIWLTAPDQSTFGADFQATADSSGAITDANIAITTDASFPVGIWSFNAQGVRSGKQAIGYFRISSAASPGDPGQLGVPVHDQLPRQGLSFILPVAAPSGATFVIVGGGFTEGESVGAWITGPDGSSTSIDETQVVVSGTAAQAIFETAGLPDGVYNAVIQGKSSNVIAAAAFKLTRDYVAGPGTPRPSSVNGGSTPPEGGTGTTFQVRGQGFQPNEDLEVWMTDPTGTYTLLPDQMLADASGRIGYDPPIDLTAPSGAIPGVYGIHFRSPASGMRVDVYFTLIGDAKAVPGSPTWVAAALGLVAPGISR
ncbi:hypothetical protein EKD04_011540 [Chloroflexales bacterium ZM16-3]|nr:hypothetical protein [Chloroflexales bacterium ZM16-3]